jgi:hypothetical protein
LIHKPKTLEKSEHVAEMYMCHFITTYNAGKHLAELCMREYPKYVKYGLWLVAEVGVIAATIPGGNESAVVHLSLVSLNVT